MVTIEALETDITGLMVDAIVNAGNTALLGGGGLDGAIHRAAGPRLLEECRTLNGCNTGDAKITGGYNLKARYVIHAVGPVWRGGHRGEDALLASCYVRSLEIAVEYDCKSIAFPAISCGIYSFPAERGAKIAIAEVRKFLKTNPGKIDHVIFALLDEDIFPIYRKLLKPKP